MKISVISSPALCQVPLIEMSGSTIVDNAAKVAGRPAGLLARIIANFWRVIASRVPVGYEDETGFHLGVAAASFSGTPTGRIPGPHCPVNPG